MSTVGILLLFTPLVAFIGLMFHVFFQNPKGWGNRLFALYMLNLALAAYATVLTYVVVDRAAAGTAMVLILITNYALNGPFLTALVVACFYPRALFRWYVLPPLMGIAFLFVAALLSDGLAHTGIIYVAHPELGQRYIPTTELIAGPGGPFLRMWLFLSMGVALVLLIVAWVRARGNERVPISFLVLSIVLVGALMPLLPATPFSSLIPALLLSASLAVAVGRYRFLVPAGVALDVVFAGSSDGMIVCNQEGLMERVNPSAEHLLAVSEGEAKGRPLAEALGTFLQRVEREPGEVSLLEAIGQDGGEPIEVVLQISETDQRALQVAGVPILDSRNRRLGSLLTFRDVTEGERLRRLLAVEQDQRSRLEGTTKNLQHILSQIQHTADRLGSAAADILAATAQQAAGSSEQSAAIAQTSTTIDEVRAIAEQTSQRAQAVADLARRTAETSRSGELAVVDSIEGMQEIKDKVEIIATNILALSEQAQAVGQIIATVSEIAAQSNMLALNAAVEAARAGEAGRGFAVVAGEVRVLAEQSRAATVQVKEILGEIQRGVNTAVMATEEGMKGADAGMKLAGEAGLSIQRLAESVTESTHAAVQISAAAGQQETGMEQIAAAMGNIHQVAAQSVAGAQQVERTAEELNALAGQLRELVEQYQP